MTRLLNNMLMEFILGCEGITRNRLLEEMERENFTCNDILDTVIDNINCWEIGFTVVLYNDFTALVGNCYNKELNYITFRKNILFAHITSMYNLYFEKEGFNCERVKEEIEKTEIEKDTIYILIFAEKEFRKVSFKATNEEFLKAFEETHGLCYI